MAQDVTENKGIEVRLNIDLMRPLYLSIFL